MEQHFRTLAASVHRLTGEVFDVLTDALTAAERLANSMEPDGDRVCVVILDSEDTEVGGFWPGGGGSI